MQLAPSPLGAKKEFSGTGRFNGAPSSPLREAEDAPDRTNEFRLTKRVIRPSESAYTFGACSDV